MTPTFESWCAEVANHLDDIGRLPGESAADFVLRLYDESNKVFQNGWAPQIFATQLRDQAKLLV